MTVNCPKCEEVLAEVRSRARLLLTVHCPYDGFEFGIAVDPDPKPDLPPASTGEGAPSPT